MDRVKHIALCGQHIIGQDQVFLRDLPQSVDAGRSVCDESSQRSKTKHAMGFFLMQQRTTQACEAGSPLNQPSLNPLQNRFTQAFQNHLLSQQCLTEVSLTNRPIKQGTVSFKRRQGRTDSKVPRGKPVAGPVEGEGMRGFLRRLRPEEATHTCFRCQRCLRTGAVVSQALRVLHKCHQAGERNPLIRREQHVEFPQEADR